MTSRERRPHIAIIGGGGAMGRLFARLFQGAARELYLFDFFGVGSRPASVALTLDELRLAAGAAPWWAKAIQEDGGDESSGESPTARWHVVTVDARSRRAIAIVGPWRGDEPPYPVGTAVADSIGDLVARVAALSPNGCTIFAGQPSDAADLLPDADIVFLALGFENRSSFARALGYYTDWLKPGCLVVDLGSTKTQPMAVLSEIVPRGIGVLGAHPLFGPTVSDLTGLIVALVDPVDARDGGEWRDWFVDQVARLRMIVTRTTAAEHDDAMAFVQALTHFALLSFAYTFVRLDRDPSDLLPYRTPVFEPLLYLAARVAYLAGSNPDTYRSIQAFSTRPDARRAFLESARDLLEAIESLSPDAGSDADQLSALFRRYGAPWSPEERDRRDRQHREHFLEMGVRLVDNLNQLRQEVVASVGQVRAIEERRSGQPPRVVIGIVSLDLRDPRKHDVASQIRLRGLNLALGSVKGEAHRLAGAPERGQDLIVPVSRARLLSDAELVEWLYATNQLVERRSFVLRVPAWFDREVLARLLRGVGAAQEAHGSQIRDVTIEPVTPGGAEAPSPALPARGEGAAPSPLQRGSSVLSPRARGDQGGAASDNGPGPDPALAGTALAKVTLAIVLHPAEIVAIRQSCQSQSDGSAGEDLDRIENELATIRARIASTTPCGPDAVDSDREKDRLKHARKALVDRQTAELDRQVRRVTRARVQAICDEAVRWLLAHGCFWPRPTAQIVIQHHLDLEEPRASQFPLPRGEG